MYDLHKSSQGVVVTQARMEVVAGALPVQEHRLPLSNLDLFIPKLEVGVFFCYEKPNIGFESMVATLKKSLAEALVNYNIFAGEIVENSVGEPEVLCNNRGVDFTPAYADMELRELNLYNPDEIIGGKLVPKIKKGGIFAVQVTEFKCGSVMVSCKFHHQVADAYACNMFLVSWSENAMSKPLSLPPSFKRSLLKPRSPTSFRPYMDKYYTPINSLPPPHADVVDSCPTSRIYYITADQLVALQTAASSESSRQSKLVAFSAFLWQMIGKNELQKDSDTRKGGPAKLSIVIDGRTRLIDKQTPKDEADALTAFFGNVIATPYGEESAEVLSEKPLSWVAERVGKFVKQAATKDHFLDLVDLVEKYRPETTVPNIIWPNSTDGPKVLVSSGQRFPVGKINFGWGQPLIGAYYFPWELDSCGYVMPMPTPAGNGDWIVYMNMPKCQLDFIEKETPQMFKPFSFELLPPN